jgi:hypothetical protein
MAGSGAANRPQALSFAPEAAHAAARFGPAPSNCATAQKADPACATAGAYKARAHGGTAAAARAGWARSDDKRATRTAAIAVVEVGAAPAIVFSSWFSIDRPPLVRLVNLF